MIARSNPPASAFDPKRTWLIIGNRNLTPILPSEADISEPPIARVTIAQRGIAFDLWRSAMIRGWVTATLGVALTCLAGAAAIGEGFTSSVSESTHFFRLVSSYMHGDERIDFDIVSACGVRVT